MGEAGGGLTPTELVETRTRTWKWRAIARRPLNVVTLVHRPETHPGWQGTAIKEAEWSSLVQLIKEQPQRKVRHHDTTNVTFQAKQERRRDSQRRRQGGRRKNERLAKNKKNMEQRQEQLIETWVEQESEDWETAFDWKAHRTKEVPSGVSEVHGSRQSPVKDGSQLRKRATRLLGARGIRSTRQVAGRQCQ